MRAEDCPHIGRIAEPVEPRSEKCEECGDGQHLRICMTCGHVGCCESELAHNTEHFRRSGHPIIRSLPLSEGSFTWCYECGDYLTA